MPSHTFIADAVLFDMDGTLTDSISAVEAAWGKVAVDIGEDPQTVIAATHGKRAVDNLAQFMPEIKKTDIGTEVQKFEGSILYFADAYNCHGPGSRRGSTAATDLELTPELTPGSSGPPSGPPSRSSSCTANHRPSFLSHVGSALRNSTLASEHAPTFDDDDDNDEVDDALISRKVHNDGTALSDAHDAWELEAAEVDRSVRILPGVRAMIDSLPAGRYAVATSGAQTYAYGCMTRVGITPPPVTITADDKRLKAGKPAPDPFLLAAKCLGYEASNCVVFEDSPSGIRSGVASGATVIALCTSHPRDKIENCGAHYLVETMEAVKCVVQEDGRLKFTVST